MWHSQKAGEDARGPSKGKLAPLRLKDCSHNNKPSPCLKVFAQLSTRRPLRFYINLSLTL